jgi:alpha-beta hydrolase superfamily lysophospholipase
MEKFDNSDLLSHDPRVGLDYAEDELVIKKLHSKLIFQIGYRAKELFKRPLNYSGQLYCAVGSQDQIIAPKKFENYIKKFMPEAEFKTFRDGKHELHHEILRIRNPYFKYLKLSLS